MVSSGRVWLCHPKLDRCRYGSKRKSLAPPKRAIRKKPECTVGVVREIFQRIRKRMFRSLIGLLSQVARELSDKRGVERHAIVGCRQNAARSKRKHNCNSGCAHYNAAATEPCSSHIEFPKRWCPIATLFTLSRTLSRRRGSATGTHFG